MYEWRNAIRNTGLTATKATARRNIGRVKQYGVLPEHRRDFAPVKTLLAQGNLLKNEIISKGRLKDFRRPYLEKYYFNAAKHSLINSGPR